MWTHDETQFLLENYRQIGANKCALILTNKSKGAIINKASRLGLKSGVKKSARESYNTWLSLSEFELLESFTKTSDLLLHKHKTCGYEWKVRPSDILRGQNCPKCSKNNYSKISIEWIHSFNNPNILHAENGGEQIIAGFKVDGYDPSTNMVYEFHGDAYHGNLDVYSPDEFCHPFDKTKTADSLFQDTFERMNKIAEYSDITYIWENDYKKGLDSVRFT